MQSRQHRGAPAPQQPAVIHCSSFCLGAAPTWREESSPFLNIMRVGIDMMPYFCAVFGLSSTLSFTILTLAPSVPAISSSAGPIMRQGPHHSAQKSTTTGSADFKTSDSNLASDTLPTAMTTTSYVEQGRESPRKIARAGNYERGSAASRQSHVEVTCAKA